MSTIRQNGLKIVLPQCGPDEFWRLIHERYAKDDPVKWKYLAMLVLRESVDWPLEHIAYAFGHDKGHVTRSLEIVKRHLRRRFRRSPELIQLSGSYRQTDDQPADDPHSAA